MNTVFVYGTLRKFERNHHFLSHSKRINEHAWTYGLMYDTGNGYPALVESAESKVYGELYLVSDEDLKKLDWLEDYEEGGKNNLYDRIVKTIYTDSGETEAIVYLAGKGDICKQEIPYGDWRVYQFLQVKPARFYYFAYGSCMDQARFQLAKVDHMFAQKVGAGLLTDHDLRYTIKVHDGGRADIIETKGSVVEGILYECPFEAIDYLFMREGVDKGMYRAAIVEIEMNGKQFQPVLTFIVPEKSQEEAPPLHYATEILRGCKGYVSEAYYQKLEKQLKALGLQL